MNEGCNIVMICAWAAGAFAVVSVVVVRAILAYERRLAQLVRDLDAEIEGDDER